MMTWLHSEIPRQINVEVKSNPSAPLGVQILGSKRVEKMEELKNWEREEWNEKWRMYINDEPTIKFFFISFAHLPFHSSIFRFFNFPTLTFHLSLIILRFQFNFSHPGLRPPLYIEGNKESHPGLRPPLYTEGNIHSASLGVQTQLLLLRYCMNINNYTNTY